MTASMLFAQSANTRIDGNARTGDLLRAFEAMGQRLTESGLQALRSDVAAAAVKGFDEIANVFEIWHRSSLIECNPDLAAWVDRVDAMALEGSDDEGIAVDDLVAQYR
jgi:hypothetical protein